jgi:hypothetical protein
VKSVVFRVLTPCSSETAPTFRSNSRNRQPQSSGSESKPEQGARTSGIGLLFNPEVGSDMSFRNVDISELYGVTTSQQPAIRPVLGQSTSCPRPILALSLHAHTHTYLVTTCLSPQLATHCASLGPDAGHIGAGPPCPPKPSQAQLRSATLTCASDGNAVFQRQGVDSSSKH